MAVIGGVPNFVGNSPGVSAVNSITGAVTLTSPDSSLTISTSGQEVHLEAVGGGTPGSPDGSIQYNASGMFAGISGSSADADGNVAFTFSDSSSPGAGMILTGDAAGNDVLDIIGHGTNGDAALSVTNSATDGAAQAAQFNVTVTDNSGSGVSGFSKATNAVLQGANVAGDLMLGDYKQITNNGIGSAYELAGDEISIANNGTTDTLWGYVAQLQTLGTVNEHAAAYISVGPWPVDFGSFGSSAIAVGSLPTASDYPGSWKIVNDSTAILAEGQECVGSGSATALAFSDGTKWKCF